MIYSRQDIVPLVSGLLPARVARRMLGPSATVGGKLSLTRGRITCGRVRGFAAGRQCDALVIPPEAGKGRTARACIFITPRDE